MFDISFSSNLFAMNHYYPNKWYIKSKEFKESGSIRFLISNILFLIA